MKPLLPFIAARQAVLLATLAGSLLYPLQASAEGRTPASGPITAPAQEFTYESLRSVLLGSMALYSGDVRTAAPYYVHAAVVTRNAELAQRAMEVSAAAGLLPEALEAARQWAQSEPASVEAQEKLIAFLLLAGKDDEARQRLTSYLKQHPDRAPALFLNIGHWLDRSGNGNGRQGRLPLLQAVTKDFATLPEAQYALASAALSDNQPATGLQAIEVALRARPRWPEAALVKAGLLQLESTPKAISWLVDWQKRHKPHPMLNNYLARLYLNQERIDDARKAFELQTQLSATDAYAAYAAGLIAREQKDNAAAVRYLSMAQERGYRDPDAVNFHLGEVLAEQKKTAQALQALDAVGEGEWQVRALARATQLRLRQQQGEQALARIRAVRQEQPAAELWQMEADTLREMQRLPEALAALDQGLKAFAGDADLLYARSMIHERQGKLAEAEADLRQILDKLPDDPTALNALGYMLADRTDRLEEARQMIEKAHALKPDDPFILDSLGWVYVKLGQLERGLESLQKAYARRDDPEIAAHLVENLWRLGRKDEAHSLWQRASNQHPGHEALQKVQQHLLQKP